MKSFNIRLGNNFNAFRQDGKFTDCILHSGDLDIPCQRLILAKNSKWFADYFISHPPKSFLEKIRVDIPVNPEGILQQFIDLIYQNYAAITIQNLPLLLKMTSFYQCDDLTRILKNFYEEAESDENILFFAEKFTQLELFKESVMLAPRLAHHLKNIHNHVEPLSFTLQELFKSLSAQVFAAVLHEDTLKTLDKPAQKDASRSSVKDKTVLKPLSDDDIVQYIEQFVKSDPSKIKSDKDKEALASTIDWSSVISYQYLTRFSCDWVPARISRPLITKIIDNRRTLLTKFTKNQKNHASEVSRWYIYSWAQYCRDAKNVRDQPEINIIKFIRTLGGAAQSLNPIKYGFISSYSLGQPMNGFGPEKALLSDEHLYFMATPKGNATGNDKTGKNGQAHDKMDMPGIGLNFGPNTRFHPQTITIDSFARPKYFFSSRKLQPKPTIQSIELTTGDNEAECKNTAKPLNIVFPVTPFPAPENYPNPGLLKDYSLNNVKPFNSVLIKLHEPVTNGSYFMRVTSLEITGYFECK